MKSLKCLQNEMQSYILKQDKKIADEIIEPENMPVIGRLNVYRDGYYARLVEALMGDYPILCQLIGDSEFENIARDYLDHHPSRDFSIRDVGKSLSDYLARQKAIHPAHVEIAAFEWAMNRAELATDSYLLTLELLSKVTPDSWAELSFVLHPSLHVLTCCYNSIAFWQAARDGEPKLEIKELNQPSTTIIWRSSLDVLYRELPAIEVVLLSLLQQGCYFSDICESFLPHFDDEESVIHWLAGALREWVQAGLFSANQNMLK